MAVARASANLSDRRKRLAGCTKDMNRQNGLSGLGARFFKNSTTLSAKSRCSLTPGSGPHPVHVATVKLSGSPPPKVASPLNVPNSSGCLRRGFIKETQDPKGPRAPATTRSLRSTAQKGNENM